MIEKIVLPYSNKKDNSLYWKSKGNCKQCKRNSIPIEKCEYCGISICENCINFLYDNIDYELDPYDSLSAGLCEKCFNKLKDMKNEDGINLFVYSEK